MFDVILMCGVSGGSVAKAGEDGGRGHATTNPAAVDSLFQHPIA